MENREIEQVIHREICAERTRTAVAAAIGIPVGAFLSVGVPIYLGLHESSTAALVDFGLTAVCSPGLFFMVGNKCKQSGLRFLTEVVGFMGMGAAFPGMLLRFGIATLPALLLASMYEDDGRYQLALNLMKTANSPSCKSLEAGRLLLLYNSGHYQEALAGARKLARETEEAYSKDQSSQIKSEYIMVHGHAVAMLQSIGHKEEARGIWDNVKPIARFEPTEPAVAFPLNVLAYAGVTVGDWAGALHFAKQARETVKSALGSRWLAGDIALNHAWCYLHQGELSNAEQELSTTMNEWRMVMPASAAAMAQAYYCKGLIEQRKENNLAAAEQFQFAIEVIRRRMGAMHPTLLPVLASYAQSLLQLNRTNERQAILSEVIEIKAFHEFDEDTGSELGSSETLPQLGAFDPPGQQREGLGATGANETELSLEQIVKAVVSRDSGGLKLSLLPWFALPFAISFLATSTLGFVCVLVACTVIDSMISKIYQSRRQQGILKKLKNARVESVALVLNHRKTFFDDLSATIDQGSPSLLEGTTLTFDISKLASDQLFQGKAGSSTSARIYFDAEKDVPFVAVVAGNAMSVSRAWHLRFVPALRPLLRACRAVGFPVLVIAAGLMLYPLAAAPPQVVPVGKSPAEYLSLGRQYKVAGWTEQARDALGKAIEKGDPQVALDARRFLDTKLPRYPQPEAAVQLNIRAYNANGVLGDGAEKIWLECINKYPNFEWPYSNLGNRYVSQRRYKEGEILIRKALEINPSYVNAWIHLSECKRKQRQFAEARQCINKALALDPSDEGARLMSLLPDF